MLVRVKTIVAKNAVEYVRMREYYLFARRMVSFTEFWVPFDEKLENQLVDSFGRSDKRIREIVHVKLKGRSWFKIYRFNSYFVFLERVGNQNLCELRMSRDIDRWMRLGLIRRIFRTRSSTRNVLNLGIGREWVFGVSEMWWKYIMSGESISFGKWAHDHVIMKRMLIYKKGHIAKGHMVSNRQLKSRKRIVQIGPLF